MGQGGDAVGTLQFSCRAFGKDVCDLFTATCVWIERTIMPFCLQAEYYGRGRQGRHKLGTNI